MVRNRLHFSLIHHKKFILEFKKKPEFVLTAPSIGIVLLFGFSDVLQPNYAARWAHFQV